MTDLSDVHTSTSQRENMLHLHNDMNVPYGWLRTFCYPQMILRVRMVYCSTKHQNFSIDLASLGLFKNRKIKQYGWI